MRPAEEPHRIDSSLSAEETRLRVLQEYRVLDTGPEARFDEITHLASRICGAPIALMSLVDAERLFFKSHVGLDVQEAPFPHAFCGQAIKQRGVFMVPDAHNDERFATHPLVLQPPHIRFYAAAPLISPNGVAVGTLCVIDHVPRSLDVDQRLALEVLARQIIVQLEQRRAISRLEESLATIKTLQGLLSICAWCKKIRQEDGYWEQLEDYLLKHSDAKLSHSICPECRTTVRPDDPGE
ncbi:MAG: GAF domain-containing protein [Nitrospirae bacterium]|nr:GAF domain-containing protein [Candidatus Manganitrophaceae bacterium]